MSQTTTDVLLDLLAKKGQRPYGLHDVSQLQHAIQTALLAERDGAPASLVTAALFHDVGHMVHDLGENPAENGIDDRHEQIGSEWLARFFGPDVTEPIRLHVAAKRYLCATDRAYLGRLSQDSLLSLSLQGGPMDADEVAFFQSVPFAEWALRLRRYDDGAKIRNLPTPPLEHFRKKVEASTRT